MTPRILPENCPQFVHVPTLAILIVWFLPECRTLSLHPVNIFFNVQPKRDQADAQRQKASLQKRLAARRQAADMIVAAARPVSQQAATKAAALTDFAEEAERNALEASLLDEANRMQNEADGYERLVQSIVTSAEDAASAAVTAGAAGAPQAGEQAVAEEASESLRPVHERAIAAMEVQYENKRRAAAGKLAQRKAAAKAARAEALRAAGKTEEEITKELARVRYHLWCACTRGAGTSRKGKAQTCFLEVSSLP